MNEGIKKGEGGEKKEKKDKKRMFSWMSPKLEVRETVRYKEIDGMFKKGNKLFEVTDRKGKGVFAKRAIKKGETLFVMGGYILTIEDEDFLCGEAADKPIEISSEFSIGPRSSADLKLMPEHYLNHSCNPNAGFNGQIFLIAMKEIKKGDEVVFDYAMCMNSNKRSASYFKFKCSCGEKTCRGWVKEDDWKRPDLQKKYKGYFQWFLEKKIEKMKK